MTRTIKLTVAYDGTAYHGFQRQKGILTVQEVLETELAYIFGHRLSISAAGRTDAGVHAFGQVVSFKTEGSIPLANIVPAARSVLPQDVAVIEAKEAVEGFHARYSATGKEYIYKIAQTTLTNPFLTRYAWLFPQKLNLEKLQIAAQGLIGRQDFSSFRASGGKSDNPVRTIFYAEWKNEGEMLIFTIRGDGFLYHMVRNIVGTLVEVGIGEIKPEDFRAILRSCDRCAAGKTAPPQGLYLNSVFYCSDS
jgi:tRNA pseudouridine38-40 synthase